MLGLQAVVPCRAPGIDGRVFPALGIPVSEAALKPFGPVGLPLLLLLFAALPLFRLIFFVALLPFRLLPDAFLFLTPFDD